MKEAVIYEVRLEIDPGIEQEFDQWLAAHIAEMLRFEGFVSAETLMPEPDAAGPAGPAHAQNRIVRRVQYLVASREHLERYFDEHAGRMREQAVQRFGDAFSASREVYGLGARPARICQNCGAGLRGQYCAECGQRDKHRIISLWELIRDLVGDLFEIDSRVWRTTGPLLFRPGRLTREYLRGRRVHYTPPLRLYLVTSLLFFLVVFFDASPNLTIDGEPAAIEEVVAAIEESAADAEASAPSDEADAESPSDTCDKIEIDDEGRWANAIEQRARQACRNLTAEGGAKRFVGDLVDNAPGMMFFFLPVIALIMVVLYPLSRRYYVEHLLFFVHFHSFFFLILTLTVLFSRIPKVLPGQDLVSDFLSIAVTFYIPVYLFVAMRRVYGQSRVLTALKYAALGVAYFVSLLFTFTAMALFTALSV